METRIALSVLILLAPLACGTSKPAEPSGAVPGTASAPKPSAQPGRDTLEGTIELLVGVLQAKDYRAVVEQFANPEDIKEEAADAERLDRLVQEFGRSDKPERLLGLLLSLKGSKPEMSGDGTSAVFRGDPSLPHGGRITFRRLAGRWYLCN